MFSVASEIGRPFILVQINYRLGVFGFAASSDLALEQASKNDPSGECSYFANFGLLDQRNAFEWLRSHVQDFGGDPANVTAFGVSAGAGSLHLHILSGQPLFDRAILMSGSAPIMRPLPISMFAKNWAKITSRNRSFGSVK